MVQGVTGTKPVAKSTPKRVLFSPPGGDLDCSGGNRVHAPARPVTSSREESDSLWKTCGQDDELAEQVSSAVENEYWRGLDRSPSPPPCFALRATRYAGLCLRTRSRVPSEARSAKEGCLLGRSSRCRHRTDKTYIFHFAEISFLHTTCRQTTRCFSDKRPGGQLKCWWHPRHLLQVSRPRSRKEP